MNTSDDRAEISQFETTLKRLGKALDQFSRFEHPDAFINREKWLAHLNQPIPEEGIGIDAVLDEINDWLIPYGSPVPHPGFSSFITTGATTVSTLASTAASIASPQRYLGTSFNYIEELSLDWMAELFQIPDMKGVYSSGGSVANLVALGGARQSAYEAIGIDPAADGIPFPGRVYASSECHHTIQRSLGVLGLGRRHVSIVPCLEDGTMDTSALKSMIEQDVASERLPVAVVANAGTTNTGAIDPLMEIGIIAKEFGIWYHVDGAYGLPGILDPRIQSAYQGLSLADSVIVDPHKWLGASIGVAATYVRDRSLLERAFTQEPADYLEGSVDRSTEQSPAMEHSLDDFGIPYFDYGVELSAPSRGVIVWAMLKEIGVQGMRERVMRHNDMAKAIAEQGRSHKNLELLLEPSLSICCFRYVDKRVTDLNYLNQRLHRRLVRQNKYMPSTTKVKGQLALRPCYVGARHEMSQAHGLVAEVLRIGAELAEELAE